MDVMSQKRGGDRAASSMRDVSSDGGLSSVWVAKTFASKPGFATRKRSAALRTGKDEMTSQKTTDRETEILIVSLKYYLSVSHETTFDLGLQAGMRVHIEDSLRLRGSCILMRKFYSLDKLL